MSESRIFETRFDAGVRQHLAAGGKAALVRHMQTVMGEDRVSKYLDQTHPGGRIYFGGPENRDRTEVYRILGLAESDLKKAIDDCPLIEPTWHVAKNEFHWAMVLGIKGMLENKAREEEVRLAVAFFATHHLAWMASKFFTFHNQNVMDYAMNTLSDKFLLKQVGSMYKMMMVIAWRSHEKYAPGLLKGDDRSLMNYFINLRTRLWGVVKTFRQHYGRVQESGSYLNKSKEVRDDGRAHERESDSGRISTVATVATERLVSEAPDPRIVAAAAALADVPRSGLDTALTSIRQNEGERVRGVFLTVLDLFFEEQRAKVQDIKSRKFFDFCMSIYARSNTKDGRVERIKSDLTSLLTDHSEAFARTNREATRGNLRKAIFIVLTLHLQASAPSA